LKPNKLTAAIAMFTELTEPYLEQKRAHPARSRCIIGQGNRAST
jgi:hypothetical protein